MSIGALGSMGLQGGNRWTQPVAGASGLDFEQTLASATQTAAPAQTTAAAGAGQPDPLAPHSMGPQDPLNQYLTTSDRDAFKTLYGVDFKANGEIMVPEDMPWEQYESVRAAAGQIASGRAHGSISDADVTTKFIEKLVAGFRDRIDQGLPPFADEASSAGKVDVTA